MKYFSQNNLMFLKSIYLTWCELFEGNINVSCKIGNFQVQHCMHRTSASLSSALGTETCPDDRIVVS